jgi:tetratricopeptide (TPR) repeat protein
MNNDKSKPQNGKQSPPNQKSAKPAPAAAAAAPKASAPPVKVPPLFRQIDWLALVVAFIGVWIVYLWTLAPEQTLEDSGELCTGSFYAGIPHPPGYPFWAIYSWFWTAILPFGNVAWRVEVGESFAAAMGCGILALMVSRGSSMLIEGIEEIKAIKREWENAICLVSGIVAGLLLGLGSFMWKESDVINRISLFGVPWLLVVLAFLMRWAYAPQQRRYLYLAMLSYGWLATIHQTLLLSAPGIEILIALVLPRLGRDLFTTNSILYVLILCLMMTGTIPAINDMTFIEKAIFHFVGILSLAGAIWLIIQTGKLYTEWKAILMMGIMWALGVLVYLYEPISCMTNPPMQWGYPRTVEGFFHALSRGQYGSDVGTNIFQNPAQFIFQLFYIADGLSQSFNWAYLFVGLIPFFFILKMHKRERNWILGLAAIYLFISVALVVMLNVSADRSTAELNKVFFTASHAVFAILIGYGITILAAYVATHYEKIRNWCFVGAGAFLALALYCLADAIGKLYFGLDGQLKLALPFPKWGGWGFLAFGPNGQFGITDIPHWILQAFHPGQYGLPVYANLILVMLPIIFLVALLVYRQRGPVFILLALFCVTPLCSGLTHWYSCEQRNHWFGYWFGHDMFTPPFQDGEKLSYDNDRRAELMKDPAQAKLIYPQMTRNAILFGGTDPGRFCPTYIIFCESFIPHYCQPKQDQKFDRRDVYIITQNALADGTYLEYLRAQYFRSHQKDPYFFSELSKYLFSVGVHSFRSMVGQNYDKHKDMTPKEMQEANITPDQAQAENQRESDHDMAVASDGLYGAVNSLLLNVLDKPFTAWGKHVETYRRAAGVYPPNEIYIPSPEDSQNCFNDYYSDVERRMQHDAEFPNEPHQIQPGEDVTVDPASGRMQVSGQVAVMMINGLLCRVIFDHNPTNEFFVEESFPLPWMYPYETPFGIIMKINRDPLPELSQDDFDRDHKFWSDYSTRLCGNWITYKTTVQQIADFVQRTYIRNNYTGFTGDPRFVRDEDAQKAFSKLRSSQAGMYAWRCALPDDSPYHQKTPESQAALVNETDFAFKQAFAFCPYSPEAVFRYVQFLMQYNRLDDALVVARTCQRLDPYNDSVAALIKQLEDFQSSSGQREQIQNQLNVMQTIAGTNITDYTNTFGLAELYMSVQQPGRAAGLLRQLVSSPNVNEEGLRSSAAFFANTRDFTGLEMALKKLAVLEPRMPETWYDLARLEVILGKKDEAIKDLQTSIDLSDQRLKTNANAVNIRDVARTNMADFYPIRDSAEFQKLMSQ